MANGARSSAQQIAFLRLLLTSGIDPMSQMPLVSECLKRLIPSFSLSMIRVDEHCAPQAHYSEFFDEASHQLFAQSGHVFSARSDDPAAFGNLLRNPRAYGTLLETPPAFLAGATYEHLFRRNGIHHVLDVALRDPGGPIGILGIFRERDAPPFTRADVAIIHELYPLLVHSLRAPVAPALHEESDTALVVLDAQGTIQWASPEALTWLHDVSFGPERAPLLDARRVPEACRELVRRWLAHRHHPTSSRTLPGVPETSLPLPGGRLRLRAYGLAASPLSDGPRELVGVHLSLELHRGLKVLQALRGSPLSPQLQRLAYGLWSGDRPARLCEQLGVSPGTLKAYQKDLHRRLDVRSSSELRALLDAQSRGVSLDLRRHLPTLTKRTTTPSGG